jgi:hypothetical protein
VVAIEGTLLIDQHCLDRSTHIASILPQCGGSGGGGGRRAHVVSGGGGGGGGWCARAVERLRWRRPGGVESSRDLESFAMKSEMRRGGLVFIGLKLSAAVVN